MAPFDPLLARALSHAHAERFTGLAELADALEAHPLAASREQLAALAREALGKVPRSRDGW